MTSRAVRLFFIALIFTVGAAARGQGDTTPTPHGASRLGRIARANANNESGAPVNKFRGAKPPQRARPAASRWHVFRSPDSDFTIEFPAEPRLDEGAQKPGDVAARRRYSYYGNSLWLSVTFQDLGFPPDSRQANDLGPNIEEILAAYTVERGGKTLRVQRLAKNILEEERSIPSKQTNKDRHVISRIIQRNSRMYTLGCVPLTDGRKVEKEMCRRFFNSFRITGVPR
jgi:hypothetical protein